LKIFKRFIDYFLYLVMRARRINRFALYYVAICASMMKSLWDSLHFTTVY